MPPKVEPLDSSSPDGKLRVLTLDGGGFRGLGLLLVLQEITKAANKRNRRPTDPQLKPHEIFDIVAGSSAGGIVAVLIGRLGLDCEAAINEYIALAKALFGNNRSEFITTLLGGKPFDNATIAGYDAALDTLVGKYSAGQPIFYTDPLTKTKTVVITAGGTAQAVPSYKLDSKSLGNTWSIKDVVRAATAASTYLPAYTPPGEKVAYRDAAELQFINPKLPAKKCWDDSEVGILVNIGQWFSAVDSKLPDIAFTALKKDHAKDFNDGFLGGVPDPGSKADAIIVKYLKQAKQGRKRGVDSEKDLSQSGVLRTLDPPLGPDSRLLELVDIFFEEDVRREVGKWNTANASLITEIAEKLVKLDNRPPDPTIPEPNPDVHPYNPALNAQKPREMLPYFMTYHVIFIIDDSTSMVMTDNYQGWSDKRWKQAEQSIGPIADFTFNNQVTTVDMGFMHYRGRTPYRGIQNQRNVLDIFKQARPPQNLARIQRTPTGATLKFFLDEAIKELNSKVGDPEAYKNIPPTDIIMLTDGEADDDPKSVIHAIRQQMKQNKHNPNYIGIQIVQVGNSPLVKLQDITQGENGDMVDIVNSDGTDLTAEKLQRILLGGNHPSVRKKLRALGV